MTPKLSRPSLLWLTLTVTLLTRSSGSDDDSTMPCELPNTFVDIRIPKTEVPEHLTTYACHTQNIPIPVSALNYHAIAYLPLISNPEVMHHMILFGCPHTVKYGQKSKPHACTNADGACRTFLVQWSRGIKGVICSPPHAAIRFGPNTQIRSLSLQIHWNNEKATSNLTDMSGVRIYYSTKPHKYELGNVQIGQNDLFIPPQQTSVPQSGGCSSACTKEWLDHPIYLTRAHIHMHYLGNGGSMHLIRKGKPVQTIVEDKTFDFNNPPAHYFRKPIQILPGDEIKVTCNFNSKDGVRLRNKTVYWGEGSDGEMCYAFVTYYPRIEGFDQCIQMGTVDICNRGAGAEVVGECVFPGFVHIFKSGLAGEIISQCKDKEDNDKGGRLDGILPTDLSRFTLGLGILSRSYTKLCTQQCLQAIREVTQHPCMQGPQERVTRVKYLSNAPQWTEVRKLIEQNSARC